MSGIQTDGGKPASVTPIGIIRKGTAKVGDDAELRYTIYPLAASFEYIRNADGVLAHSLMSVRVREGKTTISLVHGGETVLDRQEVPTGWSDIDVSDDPEKIFSTLLDLGERTLTHEIKLAAERDGKRTKARNSLATLKFLATRRRDTGALEHGGQSA